ncbi:MAG: alpha/beta hydrolase [Methanobacteriaceae archaeon]|nr:alpha/beta hydrolase [Methanobacteriaceae archaeon]
MSEINIRSKKIYYEDEGQGQPILLLHGLSDSSQIWEIIKNELINDFRLISMDLMGHGNSDKIESSYSIKDFSSDVEILLESLNLEKVDVIGFSLGGAVAQQLAIQNPEMVSSLILMSTFSYIDDNLNKKLQFLQEKLLKGGCGAFYDEAIKLVLTPQFIDKYASELDYGRKICMEMNTASSLIKVIDAILKFNLKNETASISCPTLIISGADDIFTPTHFSRELNHSIHNSKLEIIDNVGHNLLVPENIPYLSELILNFLKNQ